MGFSNFFATIPTILASIPLIAQGQPSADTTNIKPITIHAYFSEQPLLGLTSSAQSLDAKQLQSQQSNTLLPAINTVAGLRMEERSPGSYRLAMRGSLIRSPFGIRNAKIYLGEFPLTDAGGNTYLNLLDPNSIANIHILKGPDGSLYGANSGGVVRIDPNGFNATEDKKEIVLATGSYGLFQEQLSIQERITENYQFSIDQSFMRSDGYRDNTALNKKTIQTAHQWQYNARNSLQLFLLYADLGYRTPGGLTQEQMDENPRQSRPAAGTSPGAREQKAGIYNKTWYAGIAHQSKISDKLVHNISVFGSNTDLENPFITNYEIRSEKNLGLRTYFSLSDTDDIMFTWQMQLGLETQKGWNKISNFDNEGGTATNTQYKDDLDNLQTSIFYRAMAKVAQRWTIEGSLGLNRATIAYDRLFPVEENNQGDIDFGNIWMPRIASSYLLSKQAAIRASISKGYSAPTLAEVRSSDNSINQELEAETGTNYEVGFRTETKNRRIVADLSAYTYQMQNGIVRQLRDNGAEYYVNAGKMDQKGVEFTLMASIISPSPAGFIRNLSYQGSLARNFYTFDDYINGDDDFSGNKMTAVPDWTISNTLTFIFPKQVFLNIFHQYVSKMPLNDANTFYAEKYNLLQAKAGVNLPSTHGVSLQFFIGVDNLLNERYSLGNDINAFGNRFFNPAAPRNYYAGLKMRL